MKPIKVAEATPLQLNWLVAKCEGLKCEVPAYADTPWVRVTDTSGLQYVCPDYSTDWAQAGPILEREGISIYRMTSDWSAAYNPSGATQDGPTPLIAAMRCFCCSKLGDTVEVPEELTCSPTPKND